MQGIDIALLLGNLLARLLQAFRHDVVVGGWRVEVGVVKHFKYSLSYWKSLSKRANLAPPGGARGQSAGRWLPGKTETRSRKSRSLAVGKAIFYFICNKEITRRQLL
jgi:hypothetical protein